MSLKKAVAVVIIYFRFQFGKGAVASTNTQPSVAAAAPVQPAVEKKQHTTCKLQVGSSSISSSISGSDIDSGSATACSKTPK